MFYSGAFLFFRYGETSRRDDQATEKAVCGPGSREEVTPRRQSPTGKSQGVQTAEGSNDHELSHGGVCRKAWVRAGKQAGDQLELNTGEGSRVYFVWYLG